MKNRYYKAVTKRDIERHNLEKVLYSNEDANKNNNDNTISLDRYTIKSFMDIKKDIN